MRAGADVISSNLPQILTTGFLVLDWTSPAFPYSTTTTVAVSATEESTESNRKRPISAVVEDTKESTDNDSLLHSGKSAVETEFTKKLNKNAMRTLSSEDEKGGHDSKDSYQKTVLTTRLKLKRSMYSSYCLDLTDERFARDTQPLVSGCQCHACRYALYSYQYDILCNYPQLLSFFL